MNQRLKPYCVICGHIFHPLEPRADHMLWCYGRLP